MIILVLLSVRWNNGRRRNQRLCLTPFKLTLSLRTSPKGASNQSLFTPMKNRQSLFTALLVLPLIVSLPASAAVVTAVYNSATDVPVTANGYTASGNTVNFTLNFAPANGAELVVVRNTARQFINGTFDNLAQGQAVRLSYGGVPYNFVANYYGGSGHDLVLVWAGSRVFGWGANQEQEAGVDRSVGLTVGTPTRMPDLGALAGKTVVEMASSSEHSIALCSDGTLAEWGQFLGPDPRFLTNVAVPVAVSTAGILSNKTVVAISPGIWGGLALCSDGTLAAWGDDASYDLGDSSSVYPGGSAVPVTVNTDTNSALYNRTVVAIASGASFYLALCSDGVLVAWGYNSFGQLGDGTDYNSPFYNSPWSRALALPVSTNSALFGKEVIGIAAGQNHGVALCSDGTVADWGDNRSGQLGDGTTTQRDLPVAVDTSGVLSNKIVVVVAAGDSHNLALCSDGTLVAWGENFFGEIGDGTTIRRLVPVQVNTSGVLSNKTVIKIACGVDYSMVLCSDGTLVAWGWDFYGQLGIGDSSSVPVPVNRSALRSADRFSGIFIGRGSETSLALVGSSTAPEPVGIRNLGAGVMQTTFTGINGFSYDIEASTNLSNWDFIATQPAGTNGQFQIAETNAPSSPARFFRGKAH